ncbi:MAG: hypothetical protein Q8O13_06600 [Candidatus Omnitrophota bacterium]|nr:hypothetical protein [Candidatus Omnitrophota bacterium]
MKKPMRFFKRKVLFLFTFLILGFPVATTFAFLAPEEKSDFTTPHPRRSAPLQTVTQSEEPSRKLPTLWEAPKAPETETWRQDLIPMIELGPKASEEEVVEAIKDYLLSHPELLGGLEPAQDLKFTYSASASSMVYVQFVQQIPTEELEVYGTYVHFSVKKLADRNVIMASYINLYPRVKNLLPLQKVQALTTLQDKARQALGINQIRATPIKENSLIRYLDGKWLRVYEANFAESEFTAVINADTGETLGRRDDRHYAVTGYIRGRGILFDPIVTGENLPTLNLKDLKVREQNGEFVYTNAQGYFIFHDIIIPNTLTATLLGRWANVSSATSPNLFVSGTVTPGTPLTLLFNPSGAAEDPTAQVNGYYHTTSIHDWVKQRLSNSLPGIDIPLPVNVNINATCNANYNGFSINFFKSGNDGYNHCINTAYDTVVYHEYGHFVDDEAGGMINGALSEGWGDVLSVYATGQPLVGEGFYGPGTFVRTADNAYQYPPDGSGEVHDVGQAWAGFAWHLRENLMASLGAAQGIAVAEQLVIPVLLANSPDIPAAVFEVVLQDDDDANPANGTPHLQEIVNAAQQHSLYPFLNLTSVRISFPAHYASLYYGDDPVTILGTADSSFGLPFQNYQLFYGQGVNPTSWSPLGPVVSTPVTNGVLGTWQIGDLPLGAYSLKLIVTTLPNLQFVHTIQVAIETPIIQITTNPADQRYPDISGDRIVWEDYRNGNSDIYLYDLLTNEERRITTHPAAQWYPAISGDRIVWMDLRNGNYDIYLYDLSTHTEQQITTNPADQRYPAISGNRIVWQDYRSGNWDIYLYLINQVENPSFEVDAGVDFYPLWDGDDVIANNLKPDGWRTLDVGILDTDVRYQGNKSLKISVINNRGYSYQDIPIEHNKRYKVSGYVKTDCVDSNCYGTILTECANQNHQNIWDYRVCGLNTHPSNIQRLYGDNDWTRIEFEVKADNPNAHFLRLLCYNTPNRSPGTPLPLGTGTVWCDAMKVEEVSNPSGGGGTCLLPGTQITLANYLTKPIKDIKIGDEVIAIQDNKPVNCKVTRVFEHPYIQGYYLIKTKDKRMLKVTAEHRLLSNATYKPVYDLKKGDSLTVLTKHKNIEQTFITSIKKIRKKVPMVYNLEIEKEHNYFAEGILVHNLKTTTVLE